MGDSELVQLSIDDFIRQFPQAADGGKISTAWLFERLKTHKHSVLPFFSSQTDAWMILGQDRSQLNSLMRLVSRALVPSYALFPTAFPQMLLFSKDAEFHKTGRQLFVGYYRLSSRLQDREKVLKILENCFKLQEEAQAQVVEARPQVSYRELYEDFQPRTLISCALPGWRARIVGWTYGITITINGWLSSLCRGQYVAH